MDQEQAEQAEECGRMIALLAIKKLSAAARDDKSNFSRLEKQQAEIAKQAQQVIDEINNEFFQEH